MTRVHLEGQEPSTLCGIDEVHMDFIPMRGNAKRFLSASARGRLFVHCIRGVVCSRTIE